MNDSLANLFGRHEGLETTLRKLSAPAIRQLNACNWSLWARPGQVWPEGEWAVWLVLAGRGYGKTRTGAETVRSVARAGTAGRIALVGETAADVRDVMVDSLLRCCPTRERPRYEPSKRRLLWPNGATASTYSGVDPEQLRGPQHGFAWVDELAKFRYSRACWDNLMLGLRIGPSPRCIVTTTPRPIALLRELVRREGHDVVVTRGTTYENLDNLAPTFRRNVLERYEHTVLGRQELLAELLDEMPGALWRRSDLEAARVDRPGPLVRIVVGVDPSVSETGEGDECGIVVAGIDENEPPRAYVLEDASIRGSPRAWADAVAAVYHRRQANLVVAEGNQGGALVREVLRSVDGGLPVETVYAAHGKAARAEPVAALYEQRRVFHAGMFPLLEDELVLWQPGRRSPNRLDALVWALTVLLVRGGALASAEIF